MRTAPLSRAARELRHDFAASARRILAPPSLLNVWEVADAHRVLSADAGAVEPGRWRTSRVPYLREIMASLTDPDVVRVVLMKSSQVGGTEVANNWILYTIAADPAPMLMLYPTDEALKLWSTIKLDAMLRESPVLQGLVVDADGRRDKRNTIRRKLFPGGSLVGLAARSSSQLRSLVSPRAIADEIDEYLPDVNKQGDPLELLERALRTFIRVGLAKMLIVSTPTDEETSRIVREHAKTDQREHRLPCPHCNHSQPLQWRDEANQYRFVFEREGEKPHEHVVPGSTRYACRACEQLIEQRWKSEMLDAGVWVPTKPVRENRGYHIWSAYSPFVSWDTIAQKFLDSRDVPADLKTFVNLWVGQAWKETGERVKPSALEARAADYGEGVDVPDGVGLLTAAMDVQGDRVEYCVWGWGAETESWVIAWDRIDGDPGQDDTFDRAGAEIFSPWRHASGAEMRPAILSVDAGYLPESVWRFTERWRARGFRVIPVVGRQGRGRPIMHRPTAQRTKKTRRIARPMWVMGTDAAKDDLLLSRLRIAAPGPHYVHFPTSLDSTFYEQLVAEELRTVYVNKRPERRWMLIPDRRNEALDLACLNLAALHELGAPVIRSLGALAEQLRRGPSAPGAGAPARRIISRGVPR